MNEDMTELLACPMDHASPLDLWATSRVGSVVQEGELACPSCGSRFAIRSGIPSFLVLQQDYLSEVKRREIAVRGEYSRLITGNIPAERCPEFDALRTALGDCRGSRLLDAGCGEGLMTAAAGPAARVVGLDFSWPHLLQFRFPHAATVDRVHGDVGRLPFRSAVFDVALASQVLEHVPSASLRGAFIGDLARTLKPRGRLIMTTYNWDRGRQGAGVPKEGFHAAGIYFYCYEPEELRAELERHFDVEAVWGVHVLLPKTYRFVKTLGKKNIYWDRLWRTRQVAHEYGHLLLAMARRRSTEP